jgi:uroporphyrin-III C-methyltransferase
MAHDTAPTDPPPAAPPVPAAVPSKPAAGHALTLIALALALAALGLGGVLWQRLDQAQQELARRSTDSGRQATEARTLAAQAESLTQALQARLSVAEVRLSEVSLQRSQLDELMLSLSRSRDDSLVQDIESALRLAQQQTQLTGSVQPLIAALQAADQRIARAAQPRLNPVQRAIARDIERIQEASLLDIPALTGRLDELIRLVDELPLANAVGTVRSGPAAPDGPAAAPEPAEPEGASVAAASPEGGNADVPKAASGAARAWQDVGAWWQTWSVRVWSGLVERSAQLVRVSRIDQPEAALLAPEQAFFLRENLKLQLLNARLALLARQIETARADVRTVELTLGRYFDQEARATRTMREALQPLFQDLRQVELPRPDESLAALAVAAGGR